MRLLKKFLCLVIAFFIAGCAGHSTLYEWGYYEDSLFDMYINPGKTSLSDEINRFEEQIEETTASDRFVPPGLHAHLAYLYFSEGDYATGMIHLQTEKKKFPESSHFVDGMINRMKK
ncbi:MAG: DUF4810 domain-containing protein [Pseudomonadota bacterium]